MKFLGTSVTDRITGFKGIVTGHVQYLSGCNQCLVAPKVNADGTFKESQWFDEQRLIVDEKKQAVTLDNGKTPGADRAAPKR